jgi:hypothetical protein
MARMSRRSIAAMLAAVMAALTLVAGVATNVVSGLLPHAWLANHLLVWSVLGALAVLAIAIAVWQVILASSNKDRSPRAGSQHGGISAGGDLHISADYVAGRDIRLAEEWPTKPDDPRDQRRTDE